MTTMASSAFAQRQASVVGGVAVVDLSPSWTALEWRAPAGPRLRGRPVGVDSNRIDVDARSCAEPHRCDPLFPARVRRRFAFPGRRSRRSSPRSPARPGNVGALSAPLDLPGRRSGDRRDALHRERHPAWERYSIPTGSSRPSRSATMAWCSFIAARRAIWRSRRLSPSAQSRYRVYQRMVVMPGRSRERRGGWSASTACAQAPTR
jgi:hypothetical protein